VLFDIAERYAQTMLVEVAYFTAYAAFGLPSVHLVRAMVAGVITVGSRSRSVYSGRRFYFFPTIGPK
jgi:hypothetical protein